MSPEIHMLCRHVPVILTLALTDHITISSQGASSNHTSDQWMEAAKALMAALGNIVSRGCIGGYLYSMIREAAEDGIKASWQLLRQRCSALMLLLSEPDTKVDSLTEQLINRAGTSAR